jgi:6-phosphogluconolactonase
VKGRLERFPDVGSLTRAAATAVRSAAERAVAERGAFLFCVSGGQTPKALYALLAGDGFADQIDWRNTQIVFGDERCVPADHADSNYRMVREALLRHVPMPEENVHRIEGEREPELAARAYEARLRALLGVAASGEPAREFDVVLLGLGQDAHTASLFPGSQDDPSRWVEARQPERGIARVTLTPTVLNAARSVLFLVAGSEKVGALARVRDAAYDPRQLPAQRIEPRGELVWLVDAAADPV